MGCRKCWSDALSDDSLLFMYSSTAFGFPSRDSKQKAWNVHQKVIQMVWGWPIQNTSTGAWPYAHFVDIPPRPVIQPRESYRTVKTNPCFRYFHTCFRYEDETGGERNLGTVESQLYVSQLWVPLVCTSNWHSIIQNTLHGVIRKIIFTCTSLSVLSPNFWVPTWTYNRDSTVFLKINLSTTTQMKTPSWELSIDIVIHSVIFTNNPITLFPCFTLIKIKS